MTESGFSIDIAGMTCAACAQRIERLLQRDGAFASITVDLAGDRAILRPVAGLTAGEATQRAARVIEAAGYHAYPRGGTQAERRAARERREAETRAEARWLFIRAAVSMLVFLPFAFAMVVETLAGDGHHLIPPMAQAVLASLVQGFCGWPFYQKAWRAIRGGIATMDVLVVLGTTAAYGLSLYHLVAEGDAHGVPLYFEGSVAVIAFVLVGKLVEQKAKREAGAALSALASLLPDQVDVQEEGGSTRRLALSGVKPGMVVIARPGTMLPVDGLIVEGTAFLDESSLTGESFPVRRAVGERVQAGSQVSGGTLAIRADAVEDETRLARLARLIEDADPGNSMRLPMIDLLTRIFVPFVLLLAAACFAGWLWAGAGFERAAIIAASVLVVACPCALGLATPIALMAGRRAGARLGLIVVDHGAFEPGARLDVVAFDKTGTLTTGQPHLIAIRPLMKDTTVLAMAAALSARSDHPLDHAISAAAKAEGLALPPVEAWQAASGGGLSGKIDGTVIRLGSQAFACPGNETAFAALIDQLSHAEGQQPAAFFSVDGEPCAVFVAGDPLRPESADAISALRKLGLRSIILSGDRQAVVDEVAGRLGTDEAHGGMKPEDKLAFMQRQQADGRVLAFVGDGLNDGPALRSVAVGLAMGTGTDVAKGAASVILARPDPRLVPQFYQLARRVRWGIGENLGFAFAFNIVAIPLAGLGHLSPALAGAAMALSSISVALNALRLTRWKPPLAA